MGYYRKFIPNSKVNNWAVSLEEYEITFEYIKGIKNTLADAMSRLVHRDPTSQLKQEPEGFEFGELKVEEDELDEVEVQNGENPNRREKCVVWSTDLLPAPSTFQRSMLLAIVENVL